MYPLPGRRLEHINRPQVLPLDRDKVAKVSVFEEVNPSLPKERGFEKLFSSLSLVTLSGPMLILSVP